MKAYKLFKVRRDGSIGSLFIKPRDRLPLNQWLHAENIPTKGYAVRAGWHAMAKPEAPHLSPKGRRWFEVEIEDHEQYERPKSQGGIWFLAQRMKILKPLEAV
jgi:hypothetical protein